MEKLNMSNIIIDIEGNGSQGIHQVYPYYDINTRVWLIGTYNMESHEYRAFWCPLIGDRATDKINQNCMDRNNVNRTNCLKNTPKESYKFIFNTIKDEFSGLAINIQGYWNESDMYRAFNGYVSCSNVYYSGFNCRGFDELKENNYDEDLIKHNLLKYDIKNQSNYINLSRMFKKPEPKHHHGMKWQGYKPNEVFIANSIMKNIDDCMDVVDYANRVISIMY